MPDTTPRLTLPVLLPNQAQKHVTHNEALLLLDALVQTGITECGTDTPPVAPAENAVYALGAAPTGDWTGHAGDMAIRQSGGWVFLAPQTGWRGWDLSESLLKVFDGTAWVPAVAMTDQPGLGIETSWDSVNRLAVASEASLFSHAGAGHQMKINKAATTNTASLLFQSGWSGRAEMGLAGTDDFSVKVSDGVSWFEAMRATGATGQVSFPNGIDFGGDALSHYEEGTFTPTFSIGGVSSAGVTYTTQEGYYTRIGRLVSLQAELVLSSKGSLTGSLYMVGLPFAPNPPYFPGSVYCSSGFTGLTGAVTCRVLPTAKVHLVQQGSTGVTSLTEANITDTASFKVSLQFTV